jgi:hypothetical protein
MPPTDPTSSVITDQLTRALGEAVIRIWSNLPQDVQNHLFQEAATAALCNAAAARLAVSIVRRPTDMFRAGDRPHAIETLLGRPGFC